MPATDRTSRRDVTVDVHPQGVAYKLGPGQSAVVRRKPRIGGVHVAQPEDVLTCRALAVPGRARNAGQPLDVLPGELLRLGAGRVGAAPGGQRPALVEFLGAPTERRALGLAHTAPPAVAGLVSVRVPALDDLVLVLRVVEPVEHLVRHEGFTCLSFLDGGPYRGDAAFHPVALLLEEGEVGP